MKLYTEEQVKDMLNSFIGERNVDDYLQRYYTPIELPSDEEIVNQSLLVGWTNTLFTDGAKWMRNKIQGHNK
jgi:hypothetical protein